MGARLRGRTATQRSEIRVLRRFWEGFWGKGFSDQKGSERGACYGFYSKKRVPRRVLRRGSEKAVSRRCLECPLEEYAPLSVRPIRDSQDSQYSRTMSSPVFGHFSASFGFGPVPASLTGQPHLSLGLQLARTKKIAEQSSRTTMNCRRPHFTDSNPQRTLRY